MNPKLENALHAFACVRAEGALLLIDRTGHAFPAGGHFQGVQRLRGSPDRIVLTSSSDQQAYMVACRMQTTGGNAGVVERVNTLASAPFKHAGGFQAEGDVVALGVEDDSARDRSQVLLWRCAMGSMPVKIATIARSGPRDVSTAGAVGVAAYPGGMVLAVGTWNCRTIDFYISAGNPLIDRSATFSLWRTWRSSDADEEEWIDENFGAYQSLNLLTQTNGELFMAGFHRSSGDDWMDLYSVNMSAQSPASRMLCKVAKKHMICHGGCDFSKAVGLQIVSTTRFEVYAAKGSSGDHVSGTTITLNRFRAD